MAMGNCSTITARAAREFGTVISVEVTSNMVWQKQELVSPRVPIVRTWFAAGDLWIVEEAFAVTAPADQTPLADLSRNDLVLVCVTNLGRERATFTPKLVVDTVLGCRLQGQRVVVNNHEICRPVR